MIKRRMLVSPDACTLESRDPRRAISTSPDATTPTTLVFDFPTLRQLLQSAAEKVLAEEQRGSDAAAIKYAIDVARAAELPGQRLDAARAAFDEAQAKVRRE